MSPTDVPPGDPLAPPAPADDQPLLRVTGLTKSFGSNRVLNGVDFEVRRGEVVVLIGPSGSGKTTVLRSLNGLEIPEAGSVAFTGGFSVLGLAVVVAVVASAPRLLTALRSVRRTVPKRASRIC